MSCNYRFVAAPWNMTLLLDTPEVVEEAGEMFEKPIVSKLGNVVGLWVEDNPDTTMAKMRAVLHDGSVHAVDGETKWLQPESYVEVAMAD